MKTVEDFPMSVLVRLKTKASVTHYVDRWGGSFKHVSREAFTIGIVVGHEHKILCVAFGGLIGLFDRFDILETLT